MEYTSLYRKFRPLTFDEMVGQEHITKTLKNEIIAGRVGHAYLFNGGRGTGKTSAAKILARAINCLNPKNGEPCNECEICKAALDGSLTDIVEMDAASNNSVDDIRQIRDEVNFLPTLAKYRVYIIDEVHMLSTGAFNALLKTLEEPPSHVKFILATTEPQKLPATILSRCQRFDFKKISNENIEKELEFVCKKSNINITKEAMATIAILAEGGMRDALSILERCTQEENEITEETVKDLIGIPQTASVNKLLDSILNKDTQLSLDIVNDVLNNGKDIENFLWEITKYVKDILVYKAKGKLEIYSANEIEEISKLSEKTSKEWLMQTIYELSDLANQMKWSAQKNIMFQVAIIKLCNNIQIQTSNIDNSQISQLQNKIDNLESEINIIKKSGFNNKEIVVEKIKNDKKQNEEIKKSVPKVEAKTIDGQIDNWQEIIGNIKQSGKMILYTNLLNSVASKINDMTIGISFPKGLTPFGKTILEQPENMNEIVKQVSIAFGKTMRVKILEKEDTKGDFTTKPQVSDISKELDIPINIIED